MGKPETFSELRARCWRFGPGPRITIPASGIYRAALTGLTKVRTRSQVQKIKNSLQTERHPQKKVRIVEESLRGYRQCAATARRYEISRALLTRWRREFRSGHLVADGRPKFMAVQVASDAANSANQHPSESPASSISDRVEITLANGRKLAIGVTIDPMALARLVQVLDRA